MLTLDPGQKSKVSIISEIVLRRWERKKIVFVPEMFED